MTTEESRKLVDVFRDTLHREVKAYLEICTRCGVCVDSCHAYHGNPKIEYTPVGRAEVVRRLYKRYFTWSGRLFPYFGDAMSFDETALTRLYGAAFTCTGCRRCMVHCPFGIDTQAIQGIAKILLIAAGKEPEVLSMLADASVAKGESLEFFKDSFIEGLETLREQVIEKWRGETEHVIPTEVEGADTLYVALAGAHSIVPTASIFNAAGEKWSLSFFEAVNFGAFVGDPKRTQIIAERIIMEAKRLAVKEVVICECGTAFRVMKHLTGEHPFRVRTVMEVIADYIRDGRIRVRKDIFDGPVTYHDPCQIARNGGVYEEPREIVRALFSDFVEMVPNRQENWCCGGGGGLVALDDKSFLIESGTVKAEQIRASGARIVATACENCHTQLSTLNQGHNLGVEIRFITGLVADALVQ